MLTPQDLILPPTYKAHCNRVNSGVLRQQCFDVGSKSVVCIYGLEPVCNAAQRRIKAVGREIEVSNPETSHPTRHLWCNGNMGIPETGVMSTGVAYHGETAEPAGHTQMFRNIELMCNFLPDFVVIQIAVQLGERTHTGDLQCLPCRRKLRFVVFKEMFSNELIGGTTQLPTQAAQASLKGFMVYGQCLVYEPKRSMLLRNVLNHLSSDSNFYTLNGCENDDFQLTVKPIKLDNTAKTTARLEDVLLLVLFKRTPISSQTKITDVRKCVEAQRLIINEQSSLSKDVNLLCEGKGLLSVTHKTMKINDPPWFASLATRSVAGTVRRKDTMLSPNKQIIFRKSWFHPPKNSKIARSRYKPYLCRATSGKIWREKFVHHPCPNVC